ncbi:DUF1772 domain-containing protein [Cryobacterium glaciale]|uniref:DUF1772 domain-containing protein n=1 Tax=Cryobacterium glaciale TaxID=1259145 RepID=A0A4R8V4R9_9MICO|nr:DUF1772 domain-containing protein [Cryobacterium glaciale]
MTAALGAALVGGVYLAFSLLIMPAFRAVPAAAAVAAMQRINVRALRPPFMVVFFGGAAASAAVIVLQLTSAVPAGPARIVGAVLALAAVAITVVRNVPLNNALVRVGPDSPNVSTAWHSFARSWTLANHARAVISAAGAILLMLSII